MRTAGQLFRWGLTCLLLAPLVLLAAWVTSVGAALAWGALLLIIAGAALNALAVVRGLRRISTGELLADLDGVDLSEVGPEAARRMGEPIAPRQRIIFPPEAEPLPDRGVRRRTGLAAALALLGLTAFGAYTLAIEQPLAIGQGQFTLDEIYGLWGTASRIAFTVSLTVWSTIALALTIGVAVLALVPSQNADLVLAPRRMLAAACIAGSVIVVAAAAPYFSIGISLPDDLPIMTGGVRSLGSTIFGLTGFALSATAILLTVPAWGRRRTT